MVTKQRIFELLDSSRKDKNNYNKWIEIFIGALILLSIIAIILESYRGLELRYGRAFYVFEVFTVIVFSIEYLLRIYIADLKYPHLNRWQARWKFATSGMGLIDLIAILPFYLPFIIKFDLRFVRVLRVVRLLRIFKFNRYTNAMNIIGKIFYQKRSELGVAIFVTFILLLISSTMMYYLETDVQPNKFPDIISTFWWAIATLTTVGYGDVYPVTGWGKLVGGIIALLGIGLVALPTGILSASFVEELEEQKVDKAKKSVKFKFCPHCGKSLEYLK